MKQSVTRILLLASLLAGLCACGSGGEGVTTAPAPGGNTATEFARYELANGCFGIQDAASGSYLASNAQNALAFEGASLAQATPFFLKASGLGRYLFYDPRERFMSLASGNEAVADGVSGVVDEVGSQVSGVGDLVAILGPDNPLGNLLNDVGDDVGAGGMSLADVINANRSFGLTAEPSDGSEWVVDLVPGVRQRRGDFQFSIVNRLTGEPLGVVTDQGVSNRFRFVARDGCTAYPEAELNATGTPFSGTNPDGSVFGYAETHMHLGGSEALGGRLGYGVPFHRFGITHALDDCAIDHGPNGTLDALDTVVNAERQLPPHDTQGWPTFNDWPTWGSQTHHQTYYMWIKRAWMGGLRFMVNHLVANEQLCLIWPLKENDCNEMDNIALQMQLVRDLIDYIDAQEGGPGRGFLRDVYSAAEAREVVEDGKIALIFGTENEKIFDCGEFLGMPECSREHIDEQLDIWYEMGLRAILPIHLFDNALGGTRLNEDPALNLLYQGGNLLDTGHPFATVPCEEADATGPGEAPVRQPGIFETVLLLFSGPPPLPPATVCLRNARGLTDLGDYFVNAMIDRGILIEADHAGSFSRRRMLDIAMARGVPALSGHAGFVNEERDSKRILLTGGIISNLPDESRAVTIDFIRQLADAYREVFGDTRGFATGLGADINGIHNQPPPRADARQDPLTYPFTSYDGRVTFQRQTTGNRVFDINHDGVAHYGLYPDFLADIQRSEGGEQALQFLFRSAEAYIQAMARAEAARVSR